MALLSVNGIALQEPSTYNITKGDLYSDNSYTSETGYLVMDMIRPNRVTIDVEWGRLTQAQFQAIASQISNGIESFQLTYFDYYIGQDVTGTFHAQDRSGQAIRVRRTNDGGYENYTLSTQLIEF